MDDCTAGCPGPGGPVPETVDETERRDGGRTTLIYRPAMFEAAGLIGLCLVRNVSEGGLMGKVFTALAPGTPITIRFSPRAVMAGTVRWSRDGQVGVQFEAEIDVAALLAEISLRVAAGQVARAPRLPLVFDGEMTVSASGGTTRKQWFEAQDISQYGIKLTAPNLREGDEVLLQIEGLEMRKAVVRWVRKGVAGLRFIRPLALGDLGAWVVARQLGSGSDAPLLARA